VCVCVCERYDDSVSSALVQSDADVDLCARGAIAEDKSVYTLQPVVQPVVQLAGRNVLNIHIVKKIAHTRLPSVGFRS